MIGSLIDTSKLVDGNYGDCNKVYLLYAPDVRIEYQRTVLLTALRHASIVQSRAARSDFVKKSGERSKTDINEI